MCLYEWHQYLFRTCTESMSLCLCMSVFPPVCLPAELEPQPADEGGQLQLQLLDPDKSEPQPLGLESGFQEYLRWVGGLPGHPVIENCVSIWEQEFVRGPEPGCLCNSQSTPATSVLKTPASTDVYRVPSCTQAADGDACGCEQGPAVPAAQHWAQQRGGGRPGPTAAGGVCSGGHQQRPGVQGGLQQLQGGFVWVLLVFWLRASDGVLMEPLGGCWCDNMLSCEHRLSWTEEHGRQQQQQVRLLSAGVITRRVRCCIIRLLPGQTS